jgi:hypothetical protein
MKAFRLSDVQMAFILKWGVDCLPVPEICGKAGISHATYFISIGRTVCGG